MFTFGSRVWPGLAKVAEEFGETLQVIGKLMMTRGNREHWSGADLRKDLLDELSDSKAAIRFVEMKALTEEEANYVNRRSDKKLVLFLRWHREQAEAS